MKGNAKGGNQHQRNSPGMRRHLQVSGTKAKKTCSPTSYFKGTNEGTYGGKGGGGGMAGKGDNDGDEY